MERRTNSLRGRCYERPAQFTQLSTVETPITGEGAPATTGRDLQIIGGGNVGGKGEHQNNSNQTPTEGGTGVTEEDEEDEEEEPVPSYTIVRWTEELLQVIDTELQPFTAADRKLMCPLKCRHIDPWGVWSHCGHVLATLP